MRVRRTTELGVALRDARARQHRSQQEVAERAGVQRYQVANLELGKGNPSLKTLLAVLSAVGLELQVNADGGDYLAEPARNLAKPVSLDDVLSRARKYWFARNVFTYWLMASTRARSTVTEVE